MSSEQPQPTPPVAENVEPTGPTFLERMAKDATQYVAGLKGDAPEDANVTEHDLRMRNAGKELASELNKTAVQGAVYIAGCADAVSKSLHAQYEEPTGNEEKADEGLTFKKIYEVTVKSLAETADALALSMREAEKNLTKCKNPNCTCVTCKCTDGTCQCGAAVTKSCACKNPNCTCVTCECAEGACQCGAAVTKSCACKNPNCTCVTCECAEGACQCGAAVTKSCACKNPNCTCVTCECAEGACRCGAAVTKSCACKNPNCTCVTCECAEGACRCGAAVTKSCACKNPNCTCVTCECAEGACQCGNAKAVNAEGDTEKAGGCGCEK